VQGAGGSEDGIVRPRQCATQWDSLAHIFYEGKMYNGYDASLVTSSGAAKNSIDKTRDKIVGRGVLLDVARYKGARALDPGYAITIDDLEATAAAARVSVQRGDLLLIRTGHMSRYLDKNDWRHFDLDPFPGVSVPPRCGCTKSRSPPWRATTMRSRCGPGSCRPSAPRPTSWPSPPGASRSARSSPSRSSPPTARRRAGTRSCSCPRRCP